MKTVQNYNAKLGVNKKLLKEYNTKEGVRTVYLKNGSEFQIQLFNPETYNICCEFYLNGELMEDTLIIHPGQRFWLERYLTKNTKFKFETYEVEDGDTGVDKAIKNNGEVRINFYKEKIAKKTPIPCVFSYDSYDYRPISVYYNASRELTNKISDNANTAVSKDVCLDTFTTTATDAITSSVNYCSTISCSELATPIVSTMTSTAAQTTKETGRIAEGSYSNQRFSYADMDFETLPYKTEVIKILPESRKPFTINDLPKKYCTECGAKINDRYKFCPNCGNKI